MTEYTAERDEERLDVFLARMDETFSRSRIQRLISEGRVSVGGRAEKTVKANYRLTAGETVSVDVPEPETIMAPPQTVVLFTVAPLETYM